MDKKVAIITGGARGIGLKVAEVLTATGIHVILVDILKSDLERAVEKLNGYPGSASGYNLDIRDSSQIKRFFDHVEEQYGHVEILINNAAISPKKDGKRLPTHLISEEEWIEVFGVNMTGAFMFTKYSLPFMMKQKWGRIVNISSLAGRVSSKIAGSHYAGTKSALIGFSRTVAGEYGHLGITVNNIAPGRIKTPMADTATDETNELFLQHIPLGRVGEPADVADAVKFLCSENANYITGATLDVNGGIFMN